MAFLAAEGEHDAAQEALASTTRAEWNRLVDLAIRMAPEDNRTHVAHVLKLALDNIEFGGAGLAVDFIIEPEANPCTGAMWYRAYMLQQVDGITQRIDAGLYGPDAETIKRRTVGLYVVRNIQMPEAMCVA